MCAHSYVIIVALHWLWFGSNVNKLNLQNMEKTWKYHKVYDFTFVFSNNIPLNHNRAVNIIKSCLFYSKKVDYIHLNYQLSSFFPNFSQPSTHKNKVEVIRRGQMATLKNQKSPWHTSCWIAKLNQMTVMKAKGATHSLRKSRH